MGDDDREQGEGLIPEIVIKLPKMALPKSVRRFMGDKAGRLNLNGSQRLTFAGRSTSRSEQGGEGDEKNVESLAEYVRHNAGAHVEHGRYGGRCIN